MRIDNSKAFTLWFLSLIFAPVFHTLSFGVLITQTNILTDIEFVSDKSSKDDNNKDQVYQEDHGSTEDECSLTSSSDDEDYR